MLRAVKSFVDQYVLGGERELFRDFSVQVHVVRRNFKNFMGFRDTGLIYEPVQRQDPGPGGRAGTVDDGALVTVFNKTNPGHEFWPPGPVDGSADASGQRPFRFLTARMLA